MSIGNGNKLWSEIAISRTIIFRSMKVAAVVGTVLMIINHGDALLAGDIELGRIVKIVSSYCVPFLVSTYSGMVATKESRRKELVQ